MQSTPKAKRCRRHGVNIYGPDKFDRILQRKPFGPGKGPRSRRGKISEYGQQLAEKQKVRHTYGVVERQFRKYFRESLKTPTATGHTMLRKLETRLDNAVYRAGFALTRPQARQAASHGHFLVNGHRTNKPSHPLKPNDVITAHPRSMQSSHLTSILTALEKHMPPSWMKVDPAQKRIEILSLPTEEHFEQGLDIQKVVELYSR